MRRVDERSRHADVRRLDEAVERRAAKGLVGIRFELLAQPLFDVGTELVDRVELGGGARELVVERRQHLLLDLLHRHLHRRPGFLAGTVELDVLRLAGRHPDQLLLELRQQPSRPELDDVVALAAVTRDEIDHDGVALLSRTILDRRQLGDRRAQDVQLVLDVVLRHLRLLRRAPEASSSPQPPASAAR